MPVRLCPNLGPPMTQDIHTRTNLENAAGEILRNHNVDIEEAKSGAIVRPI